MKQLLIALTVIGCNSGSLTEGSQPICDALLACPAPVAAECTGLAGPNLRKIQLARFLIPRLQGCQRGACERKGWRRI